jgi:hypothetical protein
MAENNSRYDENLGCGDMESSLLAFVVIAVETRPSDISRYEKVTSLLG